MDNLKQFKELILKYESITLKDVEDTEVYQNTKSKTVFDSDELLQELTGFGTLITCTLCKAVGIKYQKISEIGKKGCKNCIYIKETGDMCFNGVNENTYDAFSELEIETTQDVVNAYHVRAKHMREIINWQTNNIENEQER